MIETRKPARVKITHIPTGIVAVCDAHRSVKKNHDAAMRYLRSKLAARSTDEVMPVEVAVYDLPEHDPCPYDLHKWRVDKK